MRRAGHAAGIHIEAGWVATAVLVAVTATEFVIMLALGRSLSIEGLSAAGADAGLLALFSAPVIYFGVYRALRWFRRAHAQALGDRQHMEAIAQTTLESIGDPVTVLDGEMRVLYANGAALKQFGPSARSARVSEAWPALPAEALEALRATAQTGDSRDLEIRLDTASGRRAIILTVNALGSETHPGGVVAVWRDVTNLLEMDLALRKSSRAVEDSANIVIITALDGTIEYVNRAFETVTGWTRQEVVGQTPRLLNSGAHSQETYAELWRTLSQGEVWHGEMLNRRKDGRTFWASVSLSAIRDATGRVTHYFGIEEDITTRKQAEEALERKLRELDGFSYAVAHDLKGPLLGIQRLAGWIEEDLGAALTPQLRQSFERLRSRSARLVGLVDAVLRYARLGREQQPVEQVDVRALVGELIEIIDPPPHCTFELAPSLPTLETHRILLFEVLLNLMRNAIQHHRGEKARVWVSASREEHRYRFCVRDDGPGIAPKHHQAIFEVFRTLQPVTASGSTGIGLTLVKKIVEELGGTVTVESEEGEGAAFFFTWPAEAQASARQSPS